MLEEKVEEGKVCCTDRDRKCQCPHKPHEEEDDEEKTGQETSCAGNCGQNL